MMLVKYLLAIVLVELEFIEVSFEWTGGTVKRKPIGELLRRFRSAHVVAHHRISSWDNPS